MVDLKSKASHLGLAELGMCHYLGVPVGTYRKWIKGERALDSAPRRLFAVLEMIESEAPALHKSLVDAAKAQDRAQLSEKARGKGKVAKPQETRPSEPPAPFVHVVQALPGWMQQAT